MLVKPVLGKGWIFLKQNFSCTKHENFDLRVANALLDFFFLEISHIKTNGAKAQSPRLFYVFIYQDLTRCIF